MGSFDTWSPEADPGFYTYCSLVRVGIELKGVHEASESMRNLVLYFWRSLIEGAYIYVPLYTNRLSLIVCVPYGVEADNLITTSTKYSFKCLSIWSPCQNSRDRSSIRKMCCTPQICGRSHMSSQ